MASLNEILRFNKEFVENKQYEPYKTSKFPDKKILILTCMDTHTFNRIITKGDEFAKWRCKNY